MQVLLFKSCVCAANHIGAQYIIEQYVLNNWHFTLTEQYRTFSKINWH